MNELQSNENSMGKPQVHVCRTYNDLLTLKNYYHQHTHLGISNTIEQ